MSKRAKAYLHFISRPHWFSIIVSIKVLEWKLICIHSTAHHSLAMADLQNLLFIPVIFILHQIRYRSLDSTAYCYGSWPCVPNTVSNYTVNFNPLSIFSLPNHFDELREYDLVGVASFSPITSSIQQMGKVSISSNCQHIVYCASALMHDIAMGNKPEFACRLTPLVNQNKSDCLDFVFAVSENTVEVESLFLQPPKKTKTWMRNPKFEKSG